MKDVKGILLQPEEVLEYWAIIESYVKQFLAHNGESTPFSICRDCLNGYMQAWLVVDEDNEVKGCAVTKIDEYPVGNYFHIIGIAGVDWDDWKHLHTTCFEKYARMAGCESMTFWGRKGWERKLRNFKGLYGETYRPVHTIFQLDLHEPIDFKEDTK